MRSFGEAGWLVREIGLPGEMNGRAVSQWLVGCEHDTAVVKVRAALRNVRIVNKDGESVYPVLLSEGRPREADDD